MPADTLLTCPHCQGALYLPGEQGSLRGPCKTCGRLSRVEVFPRAYQETFGARSAEARISEEQAVCFEHGDRVAEAACEVCGRFLCGICHLEMLGKPYCAACLVRETRNGSIPGLVEKAERLELAALALFCLPITLGLLLGFTIASADFDPTMNYWESFGYATGFSGFMTALVSIPAGLVLLYRARTKPSRPTPSSRRVTVTVGIVVLLVACVLLGLFVIGMMVSETP